MADPIAPRKQFYPPVPYLAEFHIPETVKITLAALSGDLDTVKSELQLYKKAIKHDNLVRWLLEYGADPNLGPTTRGHSGRSYDAPAYQSTGEALNTAAERGSLTVLKMLIEYRAKVRKGFALHKAASTRNEGSERLPIMRRLLELGVDVNGTDFLVAHLGHGTPLHCAVRAGNPARIKVLIENGANIFGRNQRGVTVLETADILDQKPVIDALRQ